MACKEFAEKTCKSYPNCEGCNAHGRGGNLTFEGHVESCWAYTSNEETLKLVKIGTGSEYKVTGKIVDRLHEFEKLGYEPEQLEKILKRYDDLRRRYSMYRLMEHSTFGKCGTYQDTDSLSSKRNDAIDALYYMYKLAGDVENSQCDDIRSMYPSTIFTEDGFKLQYRTSRDFRKMVRDRIERVLQKAKKPSLKDMEIKLLKTGEISIPDIDFKDLINEKIVNEITKPFHIARPIDCPKVWITTSSSVKDDELMKKVKKVMNAMGRDFTYRAPGTFEIDEMHEVPADEGWRLVTMKVADFNRPNKNNVILDEKVFAKPIVEYVKYDTELTKKVCDALKNKKEKAMTITKKPDYMFKIKRVLFNNPATIVFWADGDKTVVKAQNGEPYDPEKGLAMAISKKALGNDRAYYEEFNKQLGRGQKHSTPEQFNSEVCHVQKYDNLHDKYHEAVCDCIDIATANETNRALSADARDYLFKALKNPKSTKTDLMHAMTKAMDCMTIIMEGKDDN